MRCPTCNKFVSFEADPTVELESLDVSNNHLEVNVTVQLCCAECGETLRQAEITTDEELDSDDHECTEYREPGSDEDYSKEDLFESSEEGVPEPSSRKVDKRDFYGYRLETYIRCKCCGTDFTKVITDDTSSSNFEDAV